MNYRMNAGGTLWSFPDLRTLMAMATPRRSGDVLAGVAAQSAEESVAARMCLAEAPLKTFLSEALIPYEDDEVTRLIIDSHDREAFCEIAHLTVGDFRDFRSKPTAKPFLVSPPASRPKWRPPFPS